MLKTINIIFNNKNNKLYTYAVISNTYKNIDKKIICYTQR